MIVFSNYHRQWWERSKNRTLTVHSYLILSQPRASLASGQLMLLQTRVTTVTPIQNNHSTPTHRASQSCFFPSKFPLYLISEEEASKKMLVQHPGRTQNWIYWCLWQWNYGLISLSFPNFLLYYISLLIGIINNTKGYCQIGQNSNCT